MGNLINAILVILIVAIVSGVSSTYFYKQGQEQAWELSKQLVPLEKGELYLCVERTGSKGVSYLTVQKLSEATKDKTLNRRELQFRLSLARDGISLQEYNNKYRDGKIGF